MNTPRPRFQMEVPYHENHALLELVRYRAAQLMGCTCGMESHRRQLLVLGESSSRMKAVLHWKNSRCFDARERAALALCEKITIEQESYLAEDHMPEILQMKSHFTRHAIIEITMAILAVNEWGLAAK